MKLGSLALFLAAVIVLQYLAIPRVARATTLVVNSTVDAPDAVPGDGMCATLSGLCTLRAAIMEANMLPGADTITLPAGIYTLADTTNLLQIGGELTIVGAGAANTVVDGSGAEAVFQNGGGRSPNHRPNNSERYEWDSHKQDRLQFRTNVRNQT